MADGDDREVVFRNHQGADYVDDDADTDSGDDNEAFHEPLPEPEQGAGDGAGAAPGHQNGRKLMMKPDTYDGSTSWLDYEAHIAVVVEVESFRRVESQRQTPRPRVRIVTGNEVPERSVLDDMASDIADLKMQLRQLIQASSANRAPGVCWGCGVPGHISRECPDRVCQRCGVKGHYAYQCESAGNGNRPGRRGADRS